MSLWLTCIILLQQHLPRSRVVASDVTIRRRKWHSPSEKGLSTLGARANVSPPLHDLHAFACTLVMNSETPPSVQLVLLYLTCRDRCRVLRLPTSAGLRHMSFGPMLIGVSDPCPGPVVFRLEVLCRLLTNWSPVPTTCPSMLSRVPLLVPPSPVLRECTQLVRVWGAVVVVRNFWNCLGRRRNSSSTVVMRPYTLAHWWSAEEVELLLLPMRLHASLELKLLQLLMQLQLLLLLKSWHPGSPRQLKAWQELQLCRELSNVG